MAEGARSVRCVHVRGGRESITVDLLWFVVARGIVSVLAISSADTIEASHGNMDLQIVNVEILEHLSKRGWNTLNKFRLCGLGAVGRGIEGALKCLQTGRAAVREQFEGAWRACELFGSSLRAHAGPASC